MPTECMASCPMCLILLSWSFFFFFSSAGIFEHLLGIAGLATRLRVWAEFVLQRARLITVVFIIWGKFFPEELLFVKS